MDQGHLQFLVHKTQRGECYVDVAMRIATMKPKSITVRENPASTYRQQNTTMQLLISAGMRRPHQANKASGRKILYDDNSWCNYHTTIGKFIIQVSNGLLTPCCLNLELSELLPVDSFNWLEYKHLVVTRRTSGEVVLSHLPSVAR